MCKQKNGQPEGLTVWSIAEVARQVVRLAPLSIRDSITSSVRPLVLIRQARICQKI